MEYRKLNIPIAVTQTADAPTVPEQAVSDHRSKPCAVRTVGGFATITLFLCRGFPVDVVARLARSRVEGDEDDDEGEGEGEGEDEDDDEGKAFELSLSSVARSSSVPDRK